MYSWTELPPGPDGQQGLGAGIAAEKPLTVSGIIADMALPDGAALRVVRFLTPERPDEQVLQPMESPKGRVRFAVPEFLVYGVARIEYQPAP